MGERMTHQLLESLKRQLLTNGVDLAQWGQGNAKTLDDLLIEILDGETTLEVIEGKLTRLTRPIAVRVMYESPTGERYLLREDRSEYTDGRPPRVRKGLEGSVTGLLKNSDNKNTLTAARRELREELGEKLGEEETVNPFFIKTTERVSNSPSYPGIQSKYVVDVFGIRLTNQQFDPNGYVEPPENPDLPGAYTTYFVWDKVEAFE